MGLVMVLHIMQSMQKRWLLERVIRLGMLISIVEMVFKGLMLITGLETPIVVVESGKLEPAFYGRGDLLLLSNFSEHNGNPLRAGELVVFRIDGRNIPIVHRIIRLHEREDGRVRFLTKGDSNSVDDRGLYPPGQQWLTEQDIIGRIQGSLPYIGIVTVYMNEYPKVKYFLLTWTAIYLLTKRDISGLSYSICFTITFLAAI